MGEHTPQSDQPEDAVPATKMAVDGPAEDAPSGHVDQVAHDQEEPATQQQIPSTQVDLMHAESTQSTIGSEPTQTAHSDLALPPAVVREQLKFCKDVLLRGLKRHKDASPFLQPVDPVALGIPDYPKVITNPMDLSTIQRKMDQSLYPTSDAFVADVRLMLQNCFTFNAPDSVVHRMGRNLEKYLENSLQRLPRDLPTPQSSTARRNSASSTPGSASSSAVRPQRAANSPRRQSATPTSSAAVSASAKKFGELSFCRNVLTELCKKQHAHLNWPFMTPVDPVALGIPDYFDVIKAPMDLGTVRKKLDLRQYTSAEHFEHDVRLVFSNCYMYNAADSDIVKMAKQLEEIFESKWATRHLHTATPSSSSSSSASRSKSVSAPYSAPSGSMAESVEERILEISRQIQALQNEMNDLIMRRKTSSAKPKKASTVASSSLSSSASVGGVRRPTFEELCRTELTFDEKRDLSEAVNSMPADKLLRVVEIIRECMPTLDGQDQGGDLIELDIESLDIRTLRKLQAYIRECKLASTKHKRKQSAAASVAPSAKQARPSGANAPLPVDLDASQPFPAESDSDEDDDGGTAGTHDGDDDGAGTDD